MNFIKKRKSASQNGYRLIDRVSEESGVRQNLFDETFRPTFDIFASVGGWESERQDEVLSYLRYVLARRRGVVLPLDIAPEDLHRCKDRWTYVIFLIALMRSLGARPVIVNENSYPFVLPMMLPEWLPEPAWEWIKGDIGALQTIAGVLSGVGYVLPNVVAVARLLDDGATLKSGTEALSCVAEPEQVVTPGQVATPEPEPVVHTTTKREMGEDFLRWLCNLEEVPAWASRERDGALVVVETPRAFIEYGQKTSRPWKGVQAGVQKLRLHELSESGSPFHQLSGKAVMRLNVENYTRKDEENADTK